MADHRDVRVGRDRPADRRTLPSVARTAVNLRFSPSKPISTCATARAMAPPAAEFFWEGLDDGSAASGRGWAALGAPAVWSVTSSFIKVMTQTSWPNASDFFNSLLSGSLSPRAAGAVELAADQLSGSAAVPSNGRYRKGFGCRPSERSTRVYDTCRVENGHIRLFAKEVLTRFRRIKPVTVS
jgi:hypothetical protein